MAIVAKADWLGTASKHFFCTYIIASPMIMPTIHMTILYYLRYIVGPCILYLTSLVD